MSKWGGWSKCTRSCGVGIQSRLRQELTSAQFGGKPCGLLSQHQLCGMINCPVDCAVTPWGTWGACNKKCIDRSVPNVVLGKRKRVRMIMTTTSDGGKQCPSLVESAPCDPGPCQIHCEVSQWHANGVADPSYDDLSNQPGSTSWSTCSKTCGRGVRKRVRFVIQHSQFGGYVCPKLKDEVECELKKCPVDCKVSNWSSWDTYANGGSKLRRTRIIRTPAAHGGQECPDLVMYKNWHTECVPHNDVGAWSQCSRTCGVGYKYRYYIHHRCSKTAVVKMQFKFREGIHCIMPKCKTAAEAKNAARQVVVPDITHPPTPAPVVAQGVRLDEELGSWRDMTQTERLQFGLPVGHFQRKQV